MKSNRTPWMVAAVILAVVATANTKSAKLKPLTRGEPAITVNPPLPGAYYSGSFDSANANVAPNAFKKAAVFDIPALNAAKVGGGGSVSTEVILPYPNYDPWILNANVASTGSLLIARAEGLDTQFVDYLPVVLMPTANTAPAMTVTATYVSSGTSRLSVDNSLSFGDRLVGVSRAGLAQGQTAHIQISASGTVLLYSLPYFADYNVTGQITALSPTYTPSHGIVDIDVTDPKWFVQTNTRTYFLAVDTSGAMSPVVFELRS